MRNILSRVGTESDMKKWKKMITAIVEMVLAGAEALWRVRCNLAAGASKTGLAVGKNEARGEGGYLAARAKKDPPSVPSGSCCGSTNEQARY